MANKDHFNISDGTNGRVSNFDSLNSFEVGKKSEKGSQPTMFAIFITVSENN